MIDYDELAREVEVMRPRQRLYEVLKKALKKRGNWKDAPRGRPWPKGVNPLAKENKKPPEK